MRYAASKPAVAAALIVFLSCWTAGSALGSPPPSTEPEIELSVALARRLLDEGKTSEAIETLKAARTRNPNDEELAVALAHAYTKDNNSFWALNVLGEFLELHPPACQARAWAAWIHIGQANLEQAEALLDTDQCTLPPELRARLLLLRVLIAEQRESKEKVLKLLDEARAIGRYYAEDHELLEALTRRYEADRVPWASWNVDLSAGWTSNGLAGAPIDTTSGTESGSLLALVGAGFRAVAPISADVKPVFDAEMRAQQLTEAPAADYSYRQLRLLPGLRVAGSLGLEVKYGFEAVHLQGGDVYSPGRPLWYAEAHRVEYEVQPAPGLLVFGGGGRRILRERVRSRYELDQGMAYSAPLGSSVRTILGLSGRWHSARSAAYALIGATALAQLEVDLGLDITLKQGLSLSGDIYPHSEGYFPSADGRDRRELLPRSTTGLWWPARHAVQGGLEYSYTRRDSTASAYGYQDHRILARLRWRLDSDELTTTVVPRLGRTPLETGRSPGRDESANQAIRELMHQDEATQRSSSCLK